MKFFKVRTPSSYLKYGDVVVYSSFHHCLYKVATQTVPGHPLWMHANVNISEVEPLAMSELKALSPHIAKAIKPEYLKSVE